MTQPRKSQVCLDTTLFYHCTSRCVRQAFLCGFDCETSKDYEHRRAWIEEKILWLAEVFCIEVLTYCVMSNHYHVIFRVDPDKAKALTVAEVAERWGKLHSVHDVVKRYLDHDVLSDGEYRLAEAKIDHWRENLYNLSKFMGFLNEKTARRANKEDKKKGRFWDDRFKSQALLGEEAAIQCMAYVDLNPVRAKMHDTPEQSVHTGIYYRLNTPFNNLMPFSDEKTPFDKYNTTIPCEWEDYLELVDWTGRAIVNGKRGSIPLEFPSILSRLGKTPSEWMTQMTPNPSFTERAIGTVEQVKAYCKAIGLKWIWRRSDITA